METIIYAVIGTVVGGLILTFTLKVIVPRLKDLLCGTRYRNELATLLIQSVRDAFQGLNTWTDKEKESSEHWTTRLFSALDRLAADLGVDIRHKPKGNPNYEFLYDVCFLVTGSRAPDGFTPKTPLKQALIVLESEWDRGDKKQKILYDFSKLLIARVELRSLVFYTISSKDFDSIMRDVKALIAACEQGAQSDRYLICGIALQCLRFVLVDGRGKELYRKNH